MGVNGNLFAVELPLNLNKWDVLSRVSEDSKKFTKHVWSSIAVDQGINHPLFYPYNENIPGLDKKTKNLNPVLFDQQQTAINWNLWNIMVCHIVQGDLTLYSAVNPVDTDEKDYGFLKYPITKEKYINEGEASNDWSYLDWLKHYYLATEFIDPFAMPLKSMVYPDEDSLIIDETDGFAMAVYPQSEFKWFQDKDIIKYKIREIWTYDKNGKVVDKKMEAIAPVIGNKDQNGNIMGERILFWIDFKELSPHLTTSFILINRYKKEKIISLLEFFQQREFYASLLEDKKALLKATN
ncbi:hypothetical protein DNU06_05425 [Putridiphycobacter roseus]|uniref:Uncharacterized protein n=2 Tax=Putridiphycobacter roseus TaxID=2219161 RepID=A0A2W1NTK3_9FLAO|nr:hypothetical protein DNU06_05425 [Putridiphycobacter roseus]